MNFILLFLGLHLCLHEASAHSPDEFCTSFEALKNNHEQSHLSLAKSLTMLISPRSLIEVENVTGEKNDSNVQTTPVRDGGKYIFVQLPRPKVNLEILKKLKDQESKVSHLPLLLELKKSVDKKSCLAAVSAYPEDFGLVTEYLENYFSHRDDFNNLKDRKLFDQLVKKLKVFERRGWKLIFPEDLYDMYKFLQQKNHIQQIILISHSDDMGRLYDGRKNIFPRGAFSNLKESVKKLIIYSCHGDKVVNYYGLPKLRGKIAVYYPEIKKRYDAIFNDQVPVTSIRGMLKTAENELSGVLNYQKLCSATISLPKNGDHLFVSLNDQLLGILRFQINQIQFDCALLGEERNQVKIYYLGSEKRDPAGVQSILIKDENGQIQALKIKEYLSKNNDHHILTIGTKGGLP